MPQFHDTLAQLRQAGPTEDQNRATLELLLKIAAGPMSLAQNTTGGGACGRGLVEHRLRPAGTDPQIQPWGWAMLAAATGWVARQQIIANRIHTNARFTLYSR